MCFSGISGSEAHGDEIMVLVASLATVLGDRGSERDLCVGWFSMLICSEVRRRRGSRGAGQGPERPHCLPGRFAGVCSDFYGQLVEMARARRNSYWFWLCSGSVAMVVLFGILALVAQLFYWADIVKKLNDRLVEGSGHRDID